ncbi:MAG: hypothetical protein PHT88_03035 [Candidatus Moranbacteria bacterium]|nr:hypothetical protein [Candidatus Moranbacteria bacterium]
MRNKNQKSFLMFAKVLIFQFALVFSLFGLTQRAYAGVWGYDEANNWAIEIYDTLSIQIQDVITGVAKQAVGQLMNTQISMMVGGGNGKGPMFITNWQTFLVSDPQRQTNLYMNDFFSLTTRGRNSTANYRSAPSVDAIAQEGITNGSQVAMYGSHWETIDGRQVCVGDVPCVVAAYDKNYYKYQTDTAMSTIGSGVPNIDLMDYVRSPSDIFDGGSWRGFNAFFSNTANNPIGYSMMAGQAYQGQLAQEQRKADVQAIAYQGFKAVTGQGGVVKTPGITVGQLVDKVQGFSFDSISSAKGAGAIVGSMATIAINTVVQTGLSAATEAVQSGLDTATGSLSSATGGVLNLGLNANSLANVDWSSSGTGQSAEFNNGVNSFNSDIQSGLMGNNQVWGDMNFSGANVGSTNASNQNSYSPLDSVNFQSLQNTGSLGAAPNAFNPDTTWSAPASPQTKDPLWVGGN